MYSFSSGGPCREHQISCNDMEAKFSFKNSAGVIILFNKQYNLVYKYADSKGRQRVAVIQNDETKIIVANAYFPNDHKQGVTFAEKMYTKVLEVQSEYPDHVTFFAGDMNRC
jgi:hypothetical protein